MKYAQVREQEQEKYSQLNKECGLFWAFSNKQFDESKTPLKEGDKYIRIGMGGFLPKSNLDKWLKGMKDIERWTKRAKKNATEVILYELNNYECFYTGDITDAMPRLKELGYTLEEVKKVYHANREFALN